jgi:hypothetical protein
MLVTTTSRAIALLALAAVASAFPARIGFSVAPGTAASQWNFTSESELEALYPTAMHDFFLAAQNGTFSPRNGQNQRLFYRRFLPANLKATRGHIVVVPGFTESGVKYREFVCEYGTG